MLRCEHHIGTVRDEVQAADRLDSGGGGGENVEKNALRKPFGYLFTHTREMKQFFRMAENGLGGSYRSGLV